ARQFCSARGSNRTYWELAERSDAYGWSCRKRKTFIIVLCRAGRKPLRADLSARALQRRDARRRPSTPRVQRCQGMETQPLSGPLRMTEPQALPREDASSGFRASRAGAEAA